MYAVLRKGSGLCVYEKDVDVNCDPSHAPGPRSRQMGSLQT